MNTLDISRWQFGITTVYHFVFVPLTIGLAPLIAGMQTAWLVTGNTAWFRLTKFFGKLFLINFALGVATGIVQEFQFGMNWSQYSRFVGDVFGAPLAMEGLARILLRVHLHRVVDLWLDTPATTGPSGLHLDRGHRGQRLGVLHHRGQLVHAAPGRRALQPADPPRRTDSIEAVLTNNTAVAAFSHAVVGIVADRGRVRRRHQCVVDGPVTQPVTKGVGRGDRRRAHDVSARRPSSAVLSR